jgi:hypothetical protein
MHGRLRSWALTGSILLLVSAGCEGLNREIMMDATPRPLRLAVPSPDYHISAEDRARIPAGFDVTALERLLALVTPERRQEILAYFQKPKERRPISQGILVRLNDPELQALLEEVWAPMWDQVGATDEEIIEDVYRYPGREIALARRAAARSHPSKQH